MNTALLDRHYFRLDTYGCGYINRIQTIASGPDTPMLACDIIALSGHVSSLETRRINVIVYGPKAIQLIQQCEPHVRAGRMVVIEFWLRDLRASTFIHKKGSKAGKIDACIKAKLWQITSIRVDGQLTYQVPQGSDSDR